MIKWTVTPTVAPSLLVDRFFDNVKWWHRDKELRNSRHYHLIHYENVLDNMDRVAAGAQQFLGLEPQLMPSKQIRQRQSDEIPIERTW